VHRTTREKSIILLGLICLSVTLEWRKKESYLNKYVKFADPFLQRLHTSDPGKMQ